MTIAFVLVNVQIGEDDEVVRKLKELDGVKDAFSIYGVYDVLAKVETDMTNLRELVIRIRKIDKVTGTSTLIVAE